MTCVPNSRKAAYWAKVLILPLLFCAFPGEPVMAAEALLPIRATIVNCGSQEERPAKCQKDARCCHLEDSPEEEERQVRKDDETGSRNTVQARNEE